MWSLKVYCKVGILRLLYIKNNKINHMTTNEMITGFVGIFIGFIIANWSKIFPSNLKKYPPGSGIKIEVKCNRSKSSKPYSQDYIIKSQLVMKNIPYKYVRIIYKGYIEEPSFMGEGYHLSELEYWQ